MRKIKFRAKSFWTGRMVFGDLVHNNEGEPEICYVDDNKVRAAAICPESVAQLVGYDADGNEVYEGDVLVNESGGEFQASFKSVITSLNNSCDCRYLENLKHRKYYRLKG